MTSISKTVCVDKLDDIVNIYNKYRSTIKMKPVDVKTNIVLTLVKKVIIKILDLKLVILLEHQNINFVIKKVQNTVPQAYVIIDLKGEKRKENNVL